jgi:hypothetical protein
MQGQLPATNTECKVISTAAKFIDSVPGTITDSTIIMTSAYYKTLDL